MTAHTVVSVPVADMERSVSPTLFADLTDAAPEFGGDRVHYTVTFDAELTAGQVEAVRNRLLTKDEAQETERLALLGHLAALRTEGTDPDLYVVLADTLAYLLGEPEGNQ
jgi:hypothetical protein